MGIYDGYNPPNVASPHAPRTSVPEYGKLATASYQIARACFRFYLLAIGGSVLVVIAAPSNEALVSLVPRVLFGGISTCLVAHAIGLILGLIGLLQPARKKGRAVWGVALNGLLPCGAVAAAILSTLSMLGIR